MLGKTGKRASIVLIIGVAIPIMVATPAFSKVSGSCDASGIIEGKNYDARSLPSVVDVPRTGIVGYYGVHKGAVAGQERDYTGGGVSLKVPAGKSFPIAKWGPGKTKKASTAGPYRLSLDKSIPGGILIPISGKHVDTAGNCSGSGVIRVKGEGTYDAIGKLGSAGLATLFGLLMLLSGIAKKP